MKKSVPNRHLKIYGCILFSLVIPFAYTLYCITTSMTPPPYELNPSPLGYTKSLSIFAVPILFFWIWIFFHPEYKIERRAYFGTILGVFFLGSFLDIFFGYSFFYFPNTESYLGIMIPSFSFKTWQFVLGYLPIEEFGFYFLGATYMISLYLWGVVFWFRRYNHQNHGQVCKDADKIFVFNPVALGLCLGICALGFIIKKLGPYPDGFPGYFFFQVLVMFLPLILVYSSLKYFINWRAFSFMSFLLLLVSIVYEATIGVPYGMWKYKTEQMLGILITGWSDLPIEATLLWIAAAFGTVLVFEFLRTYFYMDRPLRQAVVGRKEPANKTQ